MRYRDILLAGQQDENAGLRIIREGIRAAHAARIAPEIDGWAATHRTDLLHKVECHGLTAHDLGPAFAEAFQGRRLWCRANCRGAFAVEPIRPSGGRDTGRRFRFSDPEDAAAFRRRWP